MVGLGTYGCMYKFSAVVFFFILIQAWKKRRHGQAELVAAFPTFNAYKYVVEVDVV